jgi:hypothetical protein
LKTQQIVQDQEMSCHSNQYHLAAGSPVFREKTDSNLIFPKLGQPCEKISQKKQALPVAPFASFALVA